MDQNIQYYLGFSYCLGIGPVTFKHLLSHFSTIEKAYTASQSELEILIGKKLSESFINHRKSFEYKKELEMMKVRSITLITQQDSRFPKQLLNISDPPICLYVKGNLDVYNFENEFIFAVVGTRKPTTYGVQVARKFAYELAVEGAIIVSGLALGIDAVAHNAALEAGKRTIAFLGSGVNIIYPRSNSYLYKQILENDGLIVSEFPPNMTTMKGLFIQRNRLISGISKGVLVAEGQKDSGSLITARFAGEQGKEVFAPPSPITSHLSEAPNLLLKEGAKLVTDIDDILDEYKMPHHKRSDDELISKLNSEEQEIYKLLSQEPIDSDSISRSLNMPVYKVLTTLSQMELQGIVEKAAGKYCIKLV